MFMALPMFRAIFKTFKRLFHTFICVYGSFIDFDVCFKALIHFLKLQLGKFFYSQ